ncbi:probable transesterase (LovD) [Ramularia collo-cygni]|uniref:Probable transesterase (LovD) n=1 Tax=Ramularia collo-cygni TaxID=112498 RepID=A0A2D3UUS7_9PEZI|nr:probable transesterase (LovD) [Ramularia collo-cygni]CZT16730.1 probable transesterase (LovD) [Ramularia collo-cygni]
MAEQDIKTAFQAALDAGKINGAIICATDAKGDFVYQKALGQRTLLSGEKKDLQLDDVLFLASATKLITTIAALQCVEAGKLSLKGDLLKIAPELAAKKVLTGFSEDGKTPVLELQKTPMNLEMLLTHSNGMAYSFMHPLIGQWLALPENSSDSSNKTVEDHFDYPLTFQPGSGWMYGPGLDYAGRIIERVAGKTLGEYFQERILSPLGIKDAQFTPVTREDLRARLVDLNPDDSEGLGAAVLGGSADINKNTKGDFGGQGLFMPGPDYMKILHSLLANDGKLLKTSTVNDMFEHHLTPEATAVHQEALAGPLGFMFRNGVAPGTKTGHGLGGVLTRQDAEGWYGDRTLSWGGGMTLTWFIDRKNDICGLGAIQTALPMDAETIDSLKHIFRRDIYKVRARSGDKPE